MIIMMIVMMMMMMMMVMMIDDDNSDYVENSNNCINHCSLYQSFDEVVMEM